MLRRLAMAAAIVAAVALIGQSTALANHVVNAGPWVRASKGSYTMCGTNQLSPDNAFGTHAFGLSITTTYTSASCGGTITSGASVRARGQVLWNNSGWTACGAVANTGYVSTGTTSVNSFNTLGCGAGEYANSTQHGGWITGTE